MTDLPTSLPCSTATFRQPHPPHDWEPQPGMNPVHCPGHDQAEATEATEVAESTTRPWTQLEARAFNAVLPALREAGEWLPLTARRKVANAVLEAVQAVELQAAVDRVRELADDAEYGTYTVDVDTLRSVLPEPPATGASA